MHNSKQTQKGGEFRPFLLVSRDIPETLADRLREKGELLLLPPFSKMPSPIASHADILTLYYKDTLYLYRSYYLENRAIFDRLPVKLSPLSLEAGEYPLDMQLDALPFGGKLLGRKKYLPKELYETKEEIVDVKQGYTRCSALVLGDRGVITADGSIEKAIMSMGGAVFSLEKGTVVLPGYNEGFIGGASAVIGNEVLFFGDILSHRQGKQILAFLAEQGYIGKSFCTGALTDYGGVTVIARR